MASDPKLLEDMHSALTDALLKRIKSGDATAADLSVARQFLKDNGIEVANIRRNRPMQDLAKLVPFAEQTGT